MRRMNSKRVAKYDLKPSVMCLEKSLVGELAGMKPRDEAIDQ